MPNNKLKNAPNQFEIDLIDLFKTLINSWKIIILISLAFLLITFIYTSQKELNYKSSILLELGSYEFIKGEKKLIEPVKSLIKELKVELNYKQQISQKQLKFSAIEGKLLMISSTSPSSEFNKNLLNESVIFIQDRHTKIVSKAKKDQQVFTSNAIKTLDNKIKYINETLVVQNETKKVTTLNDIKAIDNKIKYINETLVVQNETKKVTTLNDIKAIDNKIKYINETLVVQNETNKITTINSIKAINDRIYFLDELYSVQDKNNKVTTLKGIKAIDNEISTLQNKVKLLLELIPAEENNLYLLESNTAALLLRASTSPTLQELIYSYKEKVINVQNQIQNLILEKDELRLKFNSNSENNFMSEEMFNLVQRRDNLEQRLKTYLAENFKTEELFDLTQRRDNLEQRLKTYSAENFKTEELFDLIQKRDELELQITLAKDQEKITGKIREITSGVVTSNTKLILFLGTICGFIFSVLLVFIRKIFIQEKN